MSAALKSLPMSSQCVIEPRGDIQATILVRTQVSKIRGKSRNGAADMDHRRILSQCPNEYFAGFDGFDVKIELIFVSKTLDIARGRTTSPPKSTKLIFFSLIFINSLSGSDQGNHE